MLPFMRTKNDHCASIFAGDPSSGNETAKTIIFGDFQTRAVFARENHVVPMKSLTRRTFADIERHGNTQQRLDNKLFGMILKHGMVSFLQKDLEEFLYGLIGVKNVGDGVRLSDPRR